MQASARKITMLGTRVLVETHFCGAQLDTTRWYPDYEATVVAETADRVAVRRRWWSRKEWLPKHGPLVRIAALQR